METMLRLKGDGGATIADFVACDLCNYYRHMSFFFFSSGKIIINIIVHRKLLRYIRISSFKVMFVDHPLNAPCGLSYLIYLYLHTFENGFVLNKRALFFFLFTVPSHVSCFETTFLLVFFLVTVSLVNVVELTAE